MKVRCDSLGHSAGLAGTVTTVVMATCDGCDAMMARAHCLRATAIATTLQRRQATQAVRAGCGAG